MKVLLVEAPYSQIKSRLSSIFTDPIHYNSPESLYRIEQAVSAVADEKLWDVFRKFHPDLVVIDLDHAGELGLRFCQQLRSHEKDRHTGLIGFSKTIQSDDAVLEKVLLQGGDDFIDGKASDRELVARVNSVFRFKVMADRLRSMNHKLKTLSLTDELTGLKNMRAFHIEFQKMIKNCRKGSSGLGIIMLDLDHFKSINDTANHLVGSFVIGEVGRLIAHSGVLGKDAIAARYGGDEYIVCAPCEGIGWLWDIAERIQDLIMRSVFKKEQFTVKLTGSFGLAWVDPGFEGKPDDIIKGADVMLYRSKKQGRNMVSAMLLRYPVDFNHIGRPHLIDRDACRDHHKVTRLNNA